MMKYNTYTLDNGLRLIHLPSASQVVWCGYDLAVGSRNEESGEEGLAHFCEHMTFKGTERRSALQVINDLERVGGELNAFTNKEDTEIDKEVEVICDEIESYNDSPSELIYDEFENLIFQGHPLGHNILGRADLLRTYSTADALRFTHRHYRPDNAVFFVYGDVDFKRLCDKFTVYSLRFTDDYTIGRGSEGLAGISSVNCKPSARPEGALSSERTVNKEIGSHQAHVMTGCRAYPFNDPRRMTLYLLNNILGGPGMNARLNLSLRERHGLVYTVESSMTAYSDMGVWSVYFGCDHHDVNRCLRLVRQELDRMMLRPLSASQLSAAKRQLKGQLAIACDNREQFAIDFGRSYLHHGHERDLDSLFARIDAVRAEDIQQVAGELFPADNLTTLIFK